METCRREALPGKALCGLHAHQVTDEAMLMAERAQCLKCRAGACNATYSGGGYCEEHRA